ncbi:hypothetical protein SAY86_018934 [Trapa natans]|uniref:Kinesin motor domain-containing protein n=1 Tax=Trapa natans TaxID=22666 RepID=A0AAN7LP79_TRANT|nr:hypothetical protein SAY86_018934 [Trapa natans]
MVEETVIGSTSAEEKIFVSVRLRPLNEKEIARNDVSDWECINGDTIIYKSTLSVSERSVYPNAYTFDKVFGCGSSTRQVYEDGAKEVALAVVSGINASVFAYGQTSSGKTYTMSGITEYAIADIYNYIGQHKEREFILKFSAMEIYNESVRDLLSDDITPLRLLDDPERGTVVEKLTEEPLKDWNHFQKLLSVCEAQRQIGETALNETSSRSHQILRLIIESSASEFSGKDNSSMLAATVNFVDLAGSERASQSLSAGTRLKEGCHINRSLLTLGTVIRKLSKGRTGHIPFRDSKLTRILQSSLGGNAKTSIICTMSPARSHVEQSRNTLLFASCAKEVTTNAQVNVVMSDKALLKHLQRELARLENELRSPGLSTVKSDSDALLREKDLHIQELKNDIAELIQQRNQLQSEVEELRRLMEDGGYSTVQEYSSYPKLRVRSSWDYENSTSYKPIDPECMNIGIRSFDASQYSDGHSGTDSEEQAVRIPDFDVNSSGSDAFSRLSIPVLGAGHTHILSQDESGECKDDDSEEFCKVVRCIEMEEVPSSMHLGSNNSMTYIQKPQSNQPSYLTSKEENSMDLENLNNGDEAQPESQGLSNCKEINQLESLSYAFVSLSPEQSNDNLQEKELPSSKGFKKLIRSRSCKASLMESLYLSFNEKVEVNAGIAPSEYEKDSPGSPEIYQRRFCSLNDAVPNTLSRSSSQKSMDITECNRNEYQVSRISTDEECQTKICSLDDDDDAHNNLGRSISLSSGNSAQTDRLEFQVARISTDEGYQRKICSMSNDVPNTLSRSSSQKSDFSAESNRNGYQVARIRRDDENNFEFRSDEKNCSVKFSSYLNNQCPNEEIRKIEISDDEENRNSCSSVSETENTTHAHKKAQPVDTEIQEPNEHNILASSVRNVRDVGLDPMQQDPQSPEQWHLQFRMIQKNIIELWDACNVSLVHRTYFFLLFKGDPADSIYLEVELRRLYFLKGTFDRGSQTVEGGRTLSAPSSMRDLRRERQMLSKQLQRKLPTVDREKLFLRWGIGLESRNRSLQLAHRMWTRTDDLDHISDSASMVAMLVDFVLPEQAPKEMFSLNFSPQIYGRRPSIFRKRVLSLL